MQVAKKILVSFGDSRMRRSAQRLRKQAEAFNCFDEIFIVDERALDKRFRRHFRRKLNSETRGFGYWCWKPQIILQVLDKINENDIILYLDVGCHLNVTGKERLAEYFEITRHANNGILAFQAKPPSPPLPYEGRPLLELPDFRWIKGDLLDYFNVRDNAPLISSGAIGAGVILIRKTPQSCALIKQWLLVPTQDFSLIDDSPSKSPNHKEFVEHRHDQAIFSILCKLHNVQTISAFEYWYPSKVNCCEPDWDMIKSFPIQARRDKVIMDGFFATLLRKIRSAWLRKMQ
jgi:hypothetical protein